jgi:protein TonB
MSTQNQAAAPAIVTNLDITDIVFEKKNKAYGAYVLRKLYSRFLSTAVICACGFFLLVISSPLIITYIKEKTAKKEDLSYNATQTFDINTFKKTEDEAKDKVIEKQETAVKTTVEFVAPVMKEVYQAPKDENAELGKTTQKADPNAINLDELSLPTDATGNSGPVVEKEEKQEVFRYVEEMPTFPGGMDQVPSFFAANIKYPEIARRAGVEGRVFVQFVVSKDGSITQVQVAKGIGAGCDEEAIRVVKMMPKWTPGKQNGRPVLVQVVVPIQFKLQ